MDDDTFMLLSVYRFLRLNIIMKFISTDMIILMNGCYVWGNSYECGCEDYLYICIYVAIHPLWSAPK